MSESGQKETYALWQSPSYPVTLSAGQLAKNGRISLPKGWDQTNTALDSTRQVPAVVGRPLAAQEANGIGCVHGN